MISSALKKKIIAGVVSATLVGGTGVVFASTNAGAQIQSWYNVQFGASKATIAKDTTAYGITQGTTAYGWYNDTNGTAKTNIKNAGTYQETTSKNNIDAMLKEHTDAITSQEATIENGMQAQYDDITTNTNKGINKTADDLTAMGITDVTKILNGQGKKSLKSLDTNVSAQTATDVKALQDAIVNAKSEINGLIADKQATTEASIKQNIDDEITAKEKILGDLVAKLEKDNKDAITAEGTALETQAQSDLQNEINNIFPTVPVK